MSGEDARSRLRREALAFATVSALGYALLAGLLYDRAPGLYDRMDAAFDADTGPWTILMARAEGHRERTQAHPIAVLLLNPLGQSLRVLLRLAGAEYAARLAAALLAALAGGAAVGMFLILLRRLGLPPQRARPWTVVFATSTTQVVFATLPESYAFSALSLVIVFAVAASPAAALATRVAAGVFSFGVTVTNLAAVALAAAAFPAERLAVRLRRATVVAGLVVAATAALALVQRSLHPDTVLFFVPGRLGGGYRHSLGVPASAGEVATRLAAVGSHILVSGLAAPRLRLRAGEDGSVVADFAPVAAREPTPLGLVHWLVWLLLLARGVRGALRGGTPEIAQALVAWVGFVAVLHVFFGESLFLYSCHWVFALVALAAAGHTGDERRWRLAVALLVTLQLLVNGGLVRDLLRIFGPRG